MVRTKSGHLCHGQTNQKLSEYHTFELCVLCSILLNVISTFNSDDDTCSVAIFRNNLDEAVP